MPVLSSTPLRRLGALTLLLFTLLLAWDASGLDLPLARLFGTAQGFAWRDQPTFVLLLHTLPRWFSSALLLALFIGAVRPWGFLRALASPDRWQLALSIALGMAAITLLKRVSSTSCPWDLAQFGGTLPHVSHWLWGVRDAGPGHCFPAGHASAALAYLTGWCVLRRSLAPEVARRWLVAALLAGAVLGLAQQMRGAHFMSHTLWTAWICWTLGLAIEGLRRCLPAGVARVPASLASLNKT